MMNKEDRLLHRFTAPAMTQGRFCTQSRSLEQGKLCSHYFNCHAWNEQSECSQASSMMNKEDRLLRRFTAPAMTQGVPIVRAEAMLFFRSECVQHLMIYVVGTVILTIVSRVSTFIGCCFVTNEEIL